MAEGTDETIEAPSAMAFDPAQGIAGHRRRTSTATKLREPDSVPGFVVQLSSRSDRLMCRAVYTQTLQRVPAGRLRAVQGDPC